jgi:DNA-binding NtrC family response regulator
MEPDEPPTWRVRATADGLSAEATITEDPVAIGTGARAELRLDHPDLDPYHVEIFPQGPDLLIRDLGSRAGTWLAGPARLRIVEARVERADLLLGRVHVQIRPAGQSSLAPASAPVRPLPAELDPAARAPADEVDDVVSRLLRGCSLAMWRLRRKVRQYAPILAPVLIVGERGTGKELVARALHEAGKTPRGPFVPINCAAVPEAVAESELFGHEVGAFSGAVRSHRGAFREAKGGTLFLDEIGELSSTLQAKLLRALEAGTARAVGGNASYAVEARVVAATNQDVRRRESGFREDLYDRFLADLRTPPLRERPEDVPVLVPHLLAEICRRYDKPVPDPTPFIKAARGLSLEGNVRALRNHLERAIVEDLLPREMLDDPEGAIPGGTPSAALLDLPWDLLNERLLRLYVARLLERAGDDRERMVALAGKDRATVYRWLRKTGLG